MRSEPNVSANGIAALSLAVALLKRSSRGELAALKHYAQSVCQDLMPDSVGPEAKADRERALALIADALEFARTPV